jgi:hypothetical protein
VQPCYFTDQVNPHLLNKQSFYVFILVVLVLVLELPRLKMMWKLLIKKRPSAKTSNGRGEHRMLSGNAEEYRFRLKANGLSGNINTSFVERANLTIRQPISKITHRTFGPAQLTSELEDHLYWWLAYYHFAHPPKTPKYLADERSNQCDTPQLLK